MLFETSADKGLFSSLLNSEPAQVALPVYTCGCPACGDATLPGQGGSVGAFATSPYDNAYQFVGAAATYGIGGNVDTLMSGSMWSSQDSSATTIITYSFANPWQSSFTYSQMSSSLSSFSEADKALTRQLLSSIEAVCNVDFVEVADNAAECGVLRYGYSAEPNQMSFAGYAYFPSSSAIGGDIWIGADQASSTWDFYRPNLILHETLHAMGLKHPFESGSVLSTEQNIIPNTVMSYSTVAGGSSGYMSKYPNEPMPLDIAALQYLYGASTSSAGNTTYDMADAKFQQGFHALWDAGGTDTLDGSHLARSITLDMADGSVSNIGAAVTASARPAAGGSITATYTNTLSIAKGAVIENAVGTSYADTISGNAADNTISGGMGNDRIEGRGGNDWIEGGAGLDTAIINASRSGYTVAAYGTGKTVSGGATGTDILSGVERLQFNDAKVAFDVDGNAGLAVKLLGAVNGVAASHHAGLIGSALSSLDAGTSFEGLVMSSINAALGGGASNHAVATLLVNNIAGMVMPADYIQTWAQYMDNGSYTQAAFGVAAAEFWLNAENVDIVGLTSTGIDYI
ncbi:MAG: M10 family metallopeptidase [Pseudomonadota bacterium]